MTDHLSALRSKNNPTFNEINRDSVLTAYRGSIAHNMYIPNTDPNSIDDIDLMCIVLPHPKYYLGLSEWGSRGTKDFFVDQFDIVAYELKKFVHLLLANNPNVLSLLYLRPEMYLHVNGFGHMLINSRKLFLSQKVYDSFGGYARGQFHRMTSGKFEGYMGEKRKALVQKFGYDTKNAAHLIRLLRMGIECLTHGVLNVYREHDADELLAIKRGALTLEQVKSMADDLFQQLDYWSVHTFLPLTPNYEAVDALLMDILRTHLCGGSNA